jgi:hypothetical protein
MRSDGQEHGDVLTEAVEFIRIHGISLFGINHNPDQSKWTSSPRAYGHLYIDNAGVLCPLIHPEGFERACIDWARVGPYVEALIKSYND